MTRISGNHIIRTKCCKTFFSTLAYGSLNFSASEFWTDGGTLHSLAPSTGGLCRCTCEGYFLLGDAELIETIRKPKPIAPEGWRDRTDNWLTRFFGRESKEEILWRYDTRPIEVIEAERVPLPQDVKYVKDDELIQVIESAPDDSSVMNVTRRRYWIHLNEPHREAYRLLRETDKVSFPPYAPTEAQLNNMQQILDLINQGDNPNWFEVCELYREMSKFYEAQQALDLDKDSEPRLIKMMNELIADKVNGPVRYRL